MLRSSTMLRVLGLVVAIAGSVSSWGCGTQAPPKKKIDWVSAPAGAVDEIVRAEQARAHHLGRRLLVYVGATWCEPCRRFHQAADSGALDERFGSLRFLEFDLDRDRERLTAAGYQSKLIPLIVLPDGNGRSTGRQIEGSIKGDGAVANLLPRLEALLR